MFESIGNFFKRIVKPENKELGSKDSAKERLHLVLMQDRANVSADFLELMKQEIIDVIKKYIVIDDASIDVRLTNNVNEDGTNGAPALYANIPIIHIKNESKTEKIKEFDGVNFEQKLEETKKEEKIEQTEEMPKVEVENEKSKEEKQEEKVENCDTKKEKKQEEELNGEKESKPKKPTKRKKTTNSEDKKKAKKEESDGEEDDEDVTFDDLLKAAEEEDKKKVSKG